MENILFLAHSEADGTLSTRAGGPWRCSGTEASAQRNSCRRALRAQIQSAADSISACGAQRFLAVCGRSSQPHAMPPTPLPAKHWSARQVRR